MSKKNISLKFYESKLDLTVYTAPDVLSWIDPKDGCRGVLRDISRSFREANAANPRSVDRLAKVARSDHSVIEALLDESKSQKITNIPNAEEAITNVGLVLGMAPEDYMPVAELDEDQEHELADYIEKNAIVVLGNSDGGDSSNYITDEEMRKSVLLDLAFEQLDLELSPGT